MDLSVREENQLLRCWGQLSLLNFIGVLLLKLPDENWSFDWFYDVSFS